MRRRSFLSAVALGAFAGCVGGSTSDSAGTATTTATATDSTPEPPDWFPDNREIIPAEERYRIGTIEFELTHWAYSGDIRYFDRDAEEYRQLEPRNPDNLWLNLDFEIENLGTDTIPYPEFSDFELFYGDSSYLPVETLPKGVTEGQIHDKAEEVSISPTGWLAAPSYGMSSTMTGYADLLYSIPEGETYAYLKLAPAEIFDGVDHDPLFFQIIF